MSLQALFVLAFLQVCRLAFSMVYRKNRLASTGIHNKSWANYREAADGQPYKPISSDSINRANMIQEPLM